MTDTTPHDPIKNYVDARSAGFVKHVVEGFPPDHEIVLLLERLRELYEMKPGEKLTIVSRGRDSATVTYWKKTQPTYLEYVVE